MSKFKRTISLLLAVLTIAMLLTGCKDDSPDKKSANDAPEPNDEAAETPTPTLDEIKVEVLKLNSEYASVEFPATWFSDEELRDLSSEELCEKHGFLYVEYQDPDTQQGVITAYMTKVRCEEMRLDYVDDIEKEFADRIAGTDYIYSIEHTEDFGKTTVRVDGEGYANAPFDMTPVAIGVCASMYKIFVDADAGVEVEIIDDKTEKVLFSVTYPNVWAVYKIGE